MTRSHGLVAQGFISKEQLQLKSADLIDQQNKLKITERELLLVDENFETQSKNLESLPLRQQNQLAAITREISYSTQALTESEAKRLLTIKATESGIVTAILSEVGQTLDVNKPLISIVPRNAKLEAHLYAPSRAIGFIKTGDKVLLRYQPFPYQKFGQYDGIVASVSKTAISSGELAAISTPGNGASGEPVYRIIVKVSSQSAHAYGRNIPLQPGMLLEADVLLETRCLYEWVLEPMFSLTGKI